MPVKRSRKKDKPIIVYVDGSYIKHLDSAGVGLVWKFPSPDAFSSVESVKMTDVVNSTYSELYAIWYACYQYKSSFDLNKALIIKTDSKSAINMICFKHRTRKPEIKRLVIQIRRLLWQHPNISIRYIAAHRNNKKHKYNRLADKLAKQAARGEA